MQNLLFSSWGGQIVDNRGKKAQDYDPVAQVQLPEYFKQDEKIKALMGWNGFIIRSEEVDIIDLCHAYLKALHAYAKDCDKCNYCKTGYEELMEVLDDIRNGEATDEDMEFIESAAEAIVDSSKCSIGKCGTRGRTFSLYANRNAARRYAMPRFTVAFALPSSSRYSM